MSQVAEDGRYSFEAWVRGDREGQVVSVYSILEAPSSVTSATSWPALVAEQQVRTAHAGRALRSVAKIFDLRCIAVTAGIG